MKQIVLAGGCFWGVEAYFKRIKGIIKTKVGYTDGLTADPTYKKFAQEKRIMLRLVRFFMMKRSFH